LAVAAEDRLLIVEKEVSKRQPLQVQVLRMAAYLSNQTSSRRKLLMMLLTIIVQFLTGACQQYAKRL